MYPVRLPGGDPPPDGSNDLELQLQHLLNISATGGAGPDEISAGVANVFGSGDRGSDLMLPSGGINFPNQDASYPYSIRMQGEGTGFNYKTESDKAEEKHGSWDGRFPQSQADSQGERFSGIDLSRGFPSPKSDDHVGKAVSPPQSQKSGRSVSNDSRRDARPKNELLPLNELLAKPECPEDLQAVRELLIQRSFSVDSANYSIHNYGTHLGSLLREIFEYGHRLEILSKKSVKFPRAKFYCVRCNYHMDTIVAAVNHIMHDRHVKMEKTAAVEYSVKNMCPPSADQTAYLTELLLKVSKLHGANVSETQARHDAVKRVKSIFDKSMEFECPVTITMFGSSASALGFRDSDVNVDVYLDPCGKPGRLNDSFESIRSTSTVASTACSLLNDNLEGITEVLKLIKQTSSYKGLKEVFTQRETSLSFHDTVTNLNIKLQFNQTQAVQMAKLFTEYADFDPRVKTLVICFRYVARVCGIDKQELGYLPSFCYTLMVIFYLQQAGVLPVLHSFIEDVDDQRAFASAEEAKRTWSCQNNKNVGELWLDMLHFYAELFDFKQYVISIRSEGLVRRTDKSIHRKLVIEDPCGKGVASSSVGNGRIFDYILDRFKYAYTYFSIPRTEEGGLYDGIASPYMQSAFKLRIKEVTRGGSTPRFSDRLQDMIRRKTDADGNDEAPVRSGNVTYRKIDVLDNMGRVKSYVLKDNLNTLHQVLYKREFFYQFHKDDLQSDGPPPLICKTCGLEGHARKDCPDETIPQLKPVSCPTMNTLTILNDVMHKHLERESLDDEGREIRKRIVAELHHSLEPHFNGVELVVFGSTINGFGSKNSDVDICMTLPERTPVWEDESVRTAEINEILSKIVNILKELPSFDEIVPISSAKVPIVKFRHRNSRLEGDICPGNRLPLSNTRLLTAYSMIDPRVKVLGLFLKRLMKLCGIGDASKASLSSYAYILMLIHFLQNHSTPVLPVLQEITEPGGNQCSSGPRFADGWNVAFFDKIDKLPQVWTGYGKNKQQPSVLWLDFMKYYTETFDFEKNVITIRQKKPLTRAEKLWYTESIAIEDPFDRHHNLGAGLSRRMSVHIMKSFHHLREVFHKNIDEMDGFIDFSEYYINQERMRYGEPPFDRQCKNCNRIGHWARNCMFSSNESDVDAEETGEKRSESLSYEAASSAVDGLVKLLVNGPRVVESGERSQKATTPTKKEAPPVPNPYLNMQPETVGHLEYMGRNPAKAVNAGPGLLDGNFTDHLDFNATFRYNDPGVPHQEYSDFATVDAFPNYDYGDQGQRGYVQQRFASKDVRPSVNNTESFGRTMGSNLFAGSESTRTTSAPPPGFAPLSMNDAGAMSHNTGVNHFYYPNNPPYRDFDISAVYNNPTSYQQATMYAAAAMAEEFYPESNFGNYLPIKNGFEYDSMAQPDLQQQQRFPTQSSHINGMPSLTSNNSRPPSQNELYAMPSIGMNHLAQVHHGPVTSSMMQTSQPRSQQPMSQQHIGIPSMPGHAGQYPGSYIRQQGLYQGQAPDGQDMSQYYHYQYHE